jgi:hypothetical protein
MCSINVSQEVLDAIKSGAAETFHAVLQTRGLLPEVRMFSGMAEFFRFVKFLNLEILLGVEKISVAFSTRIENCSDELI